jgi:creatinine amidohydrolase/Fe(II)-dependent formamide hydrolase-like protein
MKRETVLLGELSEPQIEAFVNGGGDTVLVPVGATEQHGPHSPLATDTLLASEVSRRVSERIGAVAAPPVPYALSYPHVGFRGVVHLRLATFCALIEDLCACFATMGMRRIVFLNAHYDNTYAIAHACAGAAERMPEGVRAFPVNYWDALTEEEHARWQGGEAGLHANRAETSGVMAIDEGLVDPVLFNRELPPFPPSRVRNPGAVHTAFFFSTPGSVHRATRSGTWGDANGSSAAEGEEYIEAGVRSTILLLEEIDATFAAMPPR